MEFNGGAQSIRFSVVVVRYTEADALTHTRRLVALFRLLE